MPPKSFGHCVQLVQAGATCRLRRLLWVHNHKAIAVCLENANYSTAGETLPKHYCNLYRLPNTRHSSQGVPTLRRTGTTSPSSEALVRRATLSPVPNGPVRGGADGRRCEVIKCEPKAEETQLTCLFTPTSALPFSEALSSSSSRASTKIFPRGHHQRYAPRYISRLIDLWTILVLYPDTLVPTKRLALVAFTLTKLELISGGWIA